MDENIMFFEKILDNLEKKNLRPSPAPNKILLRKHKSYSVIYRSVFKKKILILTQNKTLPIKFISTYSEMEKIETIQDV